MLEIKENFLIDWFNDLERNNLLILYKGEFHQSFVTSMLSYIDQKFGIRKDQLFVKSRLISVIVECLQNVCKHGEKISDFRFTQGIFMVSRAKNVFIAATGNFILNSHIETFKEFLDDINDLEKEDIKKRFKKVLKESNQTKNKGGLGILTIAKKTRGKFEYKFQPVDEKYSFFSFQVNIPAS